MGQREHRQAREQWQRCLVCRERFKLSDAAEHESSARHVARVHDVALDLLVARLSPCPCALRRWAQERS